MLLRHLRRNAVAYLALFVALGGTSYAATRITSAQIKNNTIQGKDIKNGSIKSADVGNGSLLKKDFKKGQLPSGKTGPRGQDGTNGKDGAPGGALAYAHVLADGSLDDANSKNVDPYFRTGIYCFKVSVPWHVATASIDTGGADTRDQIAVYRTVAGVKNLCSSDVTGDLQVTTRTWNGGFANKSFYVVLY